MGASIILGSCVLLALATCVGRETSSAASTDGPAVVATFIGSEACGRCHAGEYRDWRGSQHAAAMQHVSAATVLGAFDGEQFTQAGVTSTFFERDGRYFIRTDGPDGRLADFEVRYTFGLEPLQQYLVELPGGRLQAVAVAWDSRPSGQGGQRWFHLYPGDQVGHLDELHWTRRAQNWNFMCADCHSTNIRKGYDPQAGSFATAYSEVSVGCEACHGPGSAHLSWAAAPGDDDPLRGLTIALDERRGVAWDVHPATGKPLRSQPRGSQREIEACAQCHARRAQVAEGYRAGEAFLDHYLPSLLGTELYFPDGQQRDEVFIWGSWLQSRMHQAGVTCSDCHDPHTQQMLAPDNLVCAQCHAPATYDNPSHHHHPPESSGARCAECHMPETSYMVIDLRRDHSMRVPRPDQSLAHGTPNACNQCHVDRDATWATRAVRGWLGRDARGFAAFAAAFHRADRGDAGAEAALLGIANDGSQPPIVRASALERLARLGMVDRTLAREAARAEDQLLRLASITLAEVLPATERTAVLAPLLRDPRRAIRIETARSLAPVRGALSPGYLADWARAEQEYRATLHYNSDRPESLVALGSFEASLGRFEPALDAFTGARRLDPAYAPAYINAADALRIQVRDKEAAALLIEGLAAVPDSGDLHHSLGLAQVRLGLRAEALRSLQRAMELAPDTPRYTYVYAVALHSEGRPQEAIRLLQSALGRWPGNREMSAALAAFQQR